MCFYCCWRCHNISPWLYSCRCFVLLLLYLLVGFFRVCAWHRTASPHPHSSAFLSHFWLLMRHIYFDLYAMWQWQVACGTTQEGCILWARVGAACAMHLKHLITCHISTHSTIEFRLCYHGLCAMYAVVIGFHKALSCKNISRYGKPIGITKSFCALLFLLQTLSAGS